LPVLANLLALDSNNVSKATAAEVKAFLNITNVEDTALSTWTGSTNITTVGTLGALGIKTAASAVSVGVRLGGTGGSNAQVAGFQTIETVPSTNTTLYADFWSASTTSASAFTLSSRYQFYAVAVTPGAGSTITNNMGFVAGNSTAGTNNFGFYGSLTAAAGAYNLYMSGNANNFMAGALGIGSTAGLATTNLYVSMPLTGGTATTGVYSLGAVQSDSTGSASYFATNATTQAAAFTVTNLYHYLAQQTTIGAGSVITNQNGFTASSNLSGATNNYGFRGLLAAGAGDWNLYMSGTAINYLNGALLIGSTTDDTVNKLQVTGTANFTGKITSAGASFGSSVASSTTDLSLHLALYSTTFGFNITANRLNYVAGTASAHRFIVAGTDVFSIDSTGVNLGVWNGTAIAVAKGGTGATTATAGFDSLSPTTTLGDTIYHGASGTLRLAGNTAATLKVMTQTGTGTVSAAPVWTTVTGTGSVVMSTNPTFSGIAFGGVLASSVTDLSKHIQLHTAGYGFGVTGNRLNYAVATSGAHNMMVNGVDMLTVDGSGALASGIFTSGSMIRSTGYLGYATTGTGIEMYYHGPTDSGNILAIDRTAMGQKPLILAGNTVTLQGNGTAVLVASSTGAALSGTPTAPTASVGTNTTQIATTAFVLANAGGSTITQTIQNASATFALADAGTEWIHTNTTAYTWTIPLNSAVAFPIGTVINIRNMSGTGSITIAKTAGVVLRKPGLSTDNTTLTLTIWGSATIKKEASDSWIVSGVGI
jgi:hypothetical protein